MSLDADFNHYNSNKLYKSCREQCPRNKLLEIGLKKIN
jgi:hypothetical protein